MSLEKEFTRAKGLDFAFHQVHMSDRYFEIDVKQAFSDEAKIAKLVFRSGEVPEGSTLRPEIRIGEERWRITWTGNDLDFASRLRNPFRTILTQPWSYTKGWRDRAQERAEALQVWRTTPQLRLGGRTPRELVAKGSGPYEILGIGFAWVGATRDGLTIETRPLYDSAVLNRDVRWYLTHGASLREAIGLLDRQWTSVNRQMLAAWIQTMHGVAGASKGAAGRDYWTMRDDVRKELAKKVGLIKDSGDVVARLGHEMFVDQGAERRIRELARAAPVPLPRLMPLGLPKSFERFFAGR